MDPGRRLVYQLCAISLAIMTNDLAIVALSPPAAATAAL